MRCTGIADTSHRRGSAKLSRSRSRGRSRSDRDDDSLFRFTSATVIRVIQAHATQQAHTLSLLVAQVVLLARHVEEALLLVHLGPLEVRHVQKVGHGDAVLLRLPDLEDGVLVGELEEVVRCLQEQRTESEVLPLAETLATMRVLDEARRQLA